jgi:twitching motility protein PilT
MYSAIQTGSGFGMQTMDANLMALVKQNQISMGTARGAAKTPENFAG